MSLVVVDNLYIYFFCFASRTTIKLIFNNCQLACAVMLHLRAFLFWLCAKTFVFDTCIFVSNTRGINPHECDSFFNHKCLNVLYPFFYKVHNKYPGFYIPAVSSFGIRENSIKIKSMFLLPYVSMNVLALSGGISIRVQYQ